MMCNKWKFKPRNENRLTKSDWNCFFEELSDNEIKPAINFAGGEALLLPETTDIIHLAKNKGFFTTVCSNGSLIDSELAKKIDASGLDLISISLDTLNPEKFDRIRGIPGTFKKVMKGLELLSGYSNKLHIEMQPVLMEENFSDFYGLVEWVQGNTAIKGLNILALIQPHNSEADSSWNREKYNYLWPTDKEKISELFDKLLVFKKNGGKISNNSRQLEVFKRYYLEKGGFFLEHKFCPINKTFLNITPEGKIEACPFIKGSKTFLGTLPEDKLIDAIRSKNAQEIFSRMKNCNQNCHLIINCNFEESLDFYESKLD